MTFDPNSPNTTGPQGDLIDVLLGDASQNGVVDLGDIGPFVTILFSGNYSTEADVNEDGVVDLGDIGPFVDLLFP